MRVLINCDIFGNTARGLIEATCAEAGLRSDVEIVGFITSNPRVNRSLTTVDRSLRAIRRLVTAAASHTRAEYLRPFELEKLSAKQKLPLFMATDSVNDQSFLDTVLERTEPDMLFNIFGVTIFEQSTLDRFVDVVNYHDGLLPQYAGRSATSQSVYRGEVATGFTFHRLSSDVDAGPILVQNVVTTDGTAREVERRKIDAAIAAVPSLFDALAAGEVGEEQAGSRSYYSLADARALMFIDAPEALSSEELLRRDRSFSELRITIDGRSEIVTLLSDAREGEPFAFRTADGWLRAVEISYLPSRIVALRRRLSR